MERKFLKVVIATPTLERPYPEYVQALEASIPALDAAGIDHSTVFEVGCPYISAARATMLRKAMDAKADAVVFIDHDLSWRPEDLVKLIQTPDPVVTGTYRFKDASEVKYMATVHTEADGRPVVREDGCIKADRVPAGFLKITSGAVHDFMGAYPELVFGPRYSPSIDLFQHGAHKGIWWGEDYAFSRRWAEMGKDIWLIPDLELTHWGKNGTPFVGNFHEFLMTCPGGKNDLSAKAS